MSYEVDTTFGCHLWTGRLDRDGYGMTPSGRRAHLVAWERAHGAIPSGLFVDHVCRVRRCVRPAHLELVTKRENELRKSFKYRLKLTHCKNGHELKLPIVNRFGGRLCRACQGPAQAAQGDAKGMATP